jgi:hypothetical protein
MEYALLVILILILIEVTLIDLKVWRVMVEQKRHNQAVEALQSEARRRPPPGG